MVVASQGTMNTYLWLTKLLMLDGKIQQPSRGLFLKVSNYILLFTASCLFLSAMFLSAASAKYVAYNAVTSSNCMRAGRP